MPEMNLDHINRFTWVFCNLTCRGLCCWAHAQDLPAHVCMYRRVVCCAGDLKGRVTAGAVSAALRELRPVEIVGVYEDSIEGLKVMQQESQLGKSAWKITCFTCQSSCKPMGTQVTHISKVRRLLLE
jgi:hypothetical protein